MTHWKPNAERNKPTTSFTLSRENNEKLGEAAFRSGLKRSTVLDDILNDFSVDDYLRSLVRKVFPAKESEDEM